MTRTMKQSLPTLGRDLARSTAPGVPWTEVRGDLQEHGFERGEIEAIRVAFRAERLAQRIAARRRPRHARHTDDAP